ncbi:hypothetical protein ZIOFF_047171 [Zingiber officinale]|uniref:RNase H type-1 domain-containing protein n=1 Tax=Zingiber officinale TaxID=94328 RepID=A0A8J5G5R4_ZINOF|nr:hypothetical protein ZIOFF_047171 [Zingiber officinale]
MIHDQFLHIKLCSPIFPISMLVTVVYAKCDRVQRRVLWDNLLGLKPTVDDFWLIRRDFNVITGPDEHSAGCLSRLGAVHEFHDFIMLVGLLDAGFVGDRFTWTNDKIWKWLDRILISLSWNAQNFLVRVEHLGRATSDHCSLLISFPHFSSPVASFRFQKIWINHNNFLLAVRLNWMLPCFGSRLQNFSSNLEGEPCGLHAACMDHIPNLISPEENSDLLALPTIEEVKKSDVAMAVTMKLWFRFREQKTPWVVFMAKMYCGAVSPCVVPLKSNASPCWRRLLKIRNVAECQIGWILRKGKIRFWFDSWLDIGPLYQSFQIVGNLDCWVSDFIGDLGWDLSKIKQVMQAGFVEKIVNVHNFPSGGFSIDEESVLEIQKVVNTLHVKCTHTYREANMAADYLANRAFDFGEDRILDRHSIDKHLFGIWDDGIFGKSQGGGDGGISGKSQGGGAGHEDRFHTVDILMWHKCVCYVLLLQVAFLWCICGLFVFELKAILSGSDSGFSIAGYSALADENLYGLALAVFEWVNM